MTNALTTTNNNRAHAIYARIGDPMAFIETMGKVFHQSQIMGVNTPGDGQVLALTCMCEGITPLEFARTYHIINGKPSMRADMMAAKFRAAGGKIKWIETGDGGAFASAEFSFDGQTMTVRFTIEDARNLVGDKVDKPDSNWRKDRGAMLRARVVTKAIRMLAPELIAGVYTPEELDDVRVTATAVRTESDVASRRAELLAGTDISADPVIDAVYETIPTAAEASSAATGKAEQVTSPTEAGSSKGNPESPAATISDDDQPVTPDLLQEISKLGSKFPSQVEAGKPMGLKEIADGICKACKVERPQQATRKAIRTLIDRWRKALGEK